MVLTNRARPRRQSGVNALAVQTLQDDCCLVVSGGDDQSLNAAVVRCRRHCPLVMRTHGAVSLIAVVISLRFLLDNTIILITNSNFTYRTPHQQAVVFPGRQTNSVWRAFTIYLQVDALNYSYHFFPQRQNICGCVSTLRRCHLVPLVKIPYDHKSRPRAPNHSPPPTRSYQPLSSPLWPEQGCGRIFCKEG